MTLFLDLLLLFGLAPVALAGLALLAAPPATAEIVGPMGAAPAEAAPMADLRFGSDPRAIDLAALAAATLAAAWPEARRAGTRLSSAIEPGTAARFASAPALEAARAMLAAAIAASPGGEVLLTLRRQGATSVLTVLDDGGGAAAREAVLRSAARGVALGGGSLEVSAMGTDGIAVALRLPMPASRPRAEPPAAATRRSRAAKVIG